MSLIVSFVDEMYVDSLRYVTLCIIKVRISFFNKLQFYIENIKESCLRQRMNSLYLTYTITNSPIDNITFCSFYTTIRVASTELV